MGRGGGGGLKPPCKYIYIYIFGEAGGQLPHPHPSSSSAATATSNFASSFVSWTQCFCEVTHLPFIKRRNLQAVLYLSLVPKSLALSSRFFCTFLSPSLTKMLCYLSIMLRHIRCIHNMHHNMHKFLKIRNVIKNTNTTLHCLHILHSNCMEHPRDLKFYQNGHELFEIH